MIRTPAASSKETDVLSSSPDRHIQRRIDEVVAERTDRLVRFRRRIHATPEASESEVATTSLVAEALREKGLEPRVGAGGVGVVVDLDLGGDADSLVAMRSELDAVNVNDDKQVPYASTRPGLCHACGHDAHSTILVGTAITLHELREAMSGLRFRHNLRFIFQPAEENATGARSMIKQGAIDGVEAILALHVDPFLETGVVGLRPGPITSACKSFRIGVRGRSGHSARPYEAIDPVPAAVNVVSLLYQLCPRVIDSRSPLALTFTSISSGASFNAIPDDAEIRGTLRTTRTEDTDTVQRKMEDVTRSIGEATGCDVELEFLHSCPPTDNDPHIVDMLAAVAGEVLGPESVRWLQEPSLGAEDFGFFQELIPGVMVRLGAAVQDVRQRRPLHSSLFDIDEQALVVGTRFMANSAVRAAMSSGEPRA